MAKVLVGIWVPVPGGVLAGPVPGMLLADPGAKVVDIDLPDAAPALRIGQYDQRGLASARFGPAEIAGLTADGHQPNAGL
ncbi:MAG: hypothetical protein OXC08_15265 [Thiotrichales bacterium]|nr:hypothetical protein [Thiotrichales bacterium]